MPPAKKFIQVPVELVQSLMLLSSNLAGDEIKHLFENSNGRSDAHENFYGHMLNEFSIIKYLDYLLKTPKKNQKDWDTWREEYIETLLDEEYGEDECPECEHIGDRCTCEKCDNCIGLKINCVCDDCENKN